MRNNESEEMYLETILLLKRKKGSIRSVDIANELGYSKPSVCRAVKSLKEKLYVSVNDGIIDLTETGLERAVQIYERHRVITALLILLGADRELAEENACRMEHVISSELVHIIRNHVDGTMQPA